MLVDDSKIFLYGLPLDCQEGTLKDFLEAVCDNPGAVIKVSIPDKKTFAFVTLSCTEVAEHLLGNTLLYCDGVGQLYQVKACPYVKQPFKKKKVQDYKPKTTSMEIIELKAVKYKPQDHVHQLTPDYSMLSHSKPKRRKRKRDELAIWLGDVGSTTFKRKTPRQKKRKKKASKLVLHKSESFQFGNLCPESKAITTNIEDTTDTTGAVEPVVYENGQRLNKAITTNIEDTTDTTGLVEPVVHENGQRLNKAITTNIEDTTDTTGSVEPVLHENCQRLSKVKDKVPEVEIKHADDQKSSSTISSHTQVIIDRDYLGPLCLQFTSPPSVADVKNELMEKTGLPVKEQLLCYNGKKLSDSLDLRPLIDDNPDSLTLVLSAVTLNGGAAPQHQANSPDVVADSASEPSVAPRHQAPPAEVAAAIAPEPLSELEACGPITTHNEASDPDCKDDISRDSADSIHSLMAMQHKMRNIVTATMKFEAEHEECVRVLPYLEGDQVVVQFYVFSGECGIPKHLKLAAEECFEEMGVKCKWSDLYNDKTDILKVTPLEYPSGEPKRLNVFQVDEISEIISKNLHVLDQHRNVTSLQASFKITKSVQTDIPCITIYVLGKGFIPFGECEFPHTIGPYPVDVVDGFWFRTAGLWRPNTAQEQSRVLRLGASIGVHGKEVSGTLGAFVEDGGTYYALSSDHVMRHVEQEERIIHPGLSDHLNCLKYHLNEYRDMIKEITEHGSLGIEFSIEDFEESKELLEKFEVLKSIKDKHAHSERWTAWKQAKIQEHEKAFEEESNPPRVIGNYTAGVRKNVEWTDGKEYFVDAAVAKLTANEIYSLKRSGRAEMIGTFTAHISGDCSEVGDIMKAETLCKSGRSTQYTETHSLVHPNVDPPAFMKSPSWKINEGPLADMKVPLSLPQDPKQQWLKNCLCILNGRREFANCGDSGSVIFEVKEGLPGFGIIFAVHESAYQSCVIASPLQVALEALSKEISEDSNLKLVSNFAAPQHQTPSPDVVADSSPKPSVLETCGPMTTHKKVSDPDCKGGISRDSADSVHLPMARHHEITKIVAATIKFEAEHEECVRVLPYLEEDQVVVQFYVFSGECGIPEHLKLAAKECFEEMGVKCKWSDLYNDAANILKVTPLVYPPGEQPKRLDASEVDKINKVIGMNLDVLEQHRNVTSVQASYKIIKSMQTDISCITIYVLGKGFIPVGECEFPHTIGPYPVDVVDGFWFRTRTSMMHNKGQEQCEALSPGVSIGVKGEKASGTLGSIVEDGSNLYALSCDHVMEHETKKEIIHPGWNGRQNYLNYCVDQYKDRIHGVTKCSKEQEKKIELSIDSLREAKKLLDKKVREVYQVLKSFKENNINSEECMVEEQARVKTHEKAFEEELIREPRVIGNYTAGVKKNVKWTDGNEYYVDAAIAKLTADEMNRLRRSNEAEKIGISGDCSEATTEAIMNADKLCTCVWSTQFSKIHKDTHTLPVNPPVSLKPRAFKEQWLKNCLCIESGIMKFSNQGDSGAVIFEKKKDGLAGFAIVHGMHESTYKACTIASPLQVALEALSKETSEKSILRLVSKYAPPMDTPEPVVPGPNVPLSPPGKAAAAVSTGGEENIGDRSALVKALEKTESSDLSDIVQENIGDRSALVKDLEALEKTESSDLSDKVQENIGDRSAPVKDLEALEKTESSDLSDKVQELETRGQVTTNEKASGPFRKEDISGDPADGVHSPMDTRLKMKKIITATMNFEAKHEECIRVLPYCEDGQVVVQFYVFSGESGIPKHLKLAAEEYFREMKVKLKWSNLYNDSDNILKVTPLVYRGEPKRLDASQVDKINEIISENLHVLDQHRNVTSVQASFKITKSEQTKNPCITIYVLGKGFIPVGESEFPQTLGRYPVDVVNGFWFRTDETWKLTETKKQSEVLGLGASIGVQGEEASGTLGAIVEDGGTLYALSCDHVMKHPKKLEIIHPGLNDHLNYLKCKLDEYRIMIKREIIEHGSSERGVEFSIDGLRESHELTEKFKELKSIKERHKNSERWTKQEHGNVDVYEKAFEKGLQNPPRVIGTYITGIRHNEKWNDGKEYFIDAAIAELTPREVNSLKNKTVEMIGKIFDWPDKPRGECIPTTTRAIMNVGKLCKNGRTTEYTTTDRLIGASVDPPHFMIPSVDQPHFMKPSVDPPHFMKPPLFQAKPGDPLLNAYIARYFCKSCAESQPKKAEMEETSSKSSRRCESCKEGVANLCDSRWHKNCLCMYNTRVNFADSGDSGAVIFEEESKLGFGIIFAVHENAHKFYAIASPLQVALKALSKKISEDSNLRLVLKYVAPQQQGPAPEEAAVAAPEQSGAPQSQTPSPE